MNLRHWIWFMVLQTLVGPGLLGLELPELEWWQKTVIYHVYPRSMLDTNSDGIGDLKGIIASLDHFTEMGVQTFWMSPIYSSPMKDFGYDISNYTDVDPIFGTIDDFKSLMAAAKSRGLYVVLDFVPNHSSDQHEWFNKSRNREGNYTDYYIWVDGTGPNKTDPPNNWMSNFYGSSWTYDKTRGQFYYHKYLDAQPDLNYRDPNVRREMLNVLKFWLDLGVDGFRIDAIKYLFEDEQLRDEPRTYKPGVPPNKQLDHIYTEQYPEVFEVLQEWRKLSKSYEKKDGRHRLMMAEVYDDLKDTIRYYGNDSYEVVDFPFNFQMVKLNKNSTAFDLNEMVTSWLDSMPSGRWPNWLLGSHDNHRIANRSHEGLVDAYHMVTLLLGGTPITYYGEEIGMVDVFIPYNETQDPKAKFRGPDEYLKFTRDFERTPMQWDTSDYAGFTDGDHPWLPVGKNYPTLNVDVQRSDPNSHFSIYKKLVELRRVEPTILYGDRYFPLTTASIFTYARVLFGSDAGFLIIINMGFQEQTVNILDTNCCGAFSFPVSGTVEVSSGNVPSTVMTVSLDRVTLNRFEGIVIRFVPIFSYCRM